LRMKKNTKDSKMKELEIYKENTGKKRKESNEPKVEKSESITDEFVNSHKKRKKKIRESTSDEEKKKVVEDSAKFKKASEKKKIYCKSRVNSGTLQNDFESENLYKSEEENQKKDSKKKKYCEIENTEEKSINQIREIETQVKKKKKNLGVFQAIQMEDDLIYSRNEIDNSIASKEGKSNSQKQRETIFVSPEDRHQSHKSNLKMEVEVKNSIENPNEGTNQEVLNVFKMMKKLPKKSVVEDTRIVKKDSEDTFKSTKKRKFKDSEKAKKRKGDFQNSSLKVKIKRKLTPFRKALVESYVLPEQDQHASENSLNEIVAGIFSVTERKSLDRAVDLYMKEKGIPKEDLPFLFSRKMRTSIVQENMYSSRAYKDVWRTIYENSQLTSRSLRSVMDFLKRKYGATTLDVKGDDNAQFWNEEEDKLLMERFVEIGGKWTAIGQELGKKDSLVGLIKFFLKVKSRYTRLKSKSEGIEEGSWSEDETKLLLKAIETVRKKKFMLSDDYISTMTEDDFEIVLKNNWSMIANIVKTRSSRQCRLKWTRDL
ncbi:RNA polymerase I enhancer binding protein, partial [Nowakowskiella sp. JEL0078]